MTGRFAAFEDIGTASAPGTRSGWRHVPARWADVRRYAVAYLIMTVIVVALGMLIVHVLEHGTLGVIDRHAARWFADLRSGRVNHLAQIGAGLADAYTLVPAIVVTAVVFVALFRRWNEAVLLLTAILLEKAVFVTTTLIVDRARPPVGQLDGAPPTSSYPSGHVAAAVVFYGCLAVVLCWHARHTIVAVIVWSAAVLVSVSVAVSRMILGMHYLTDVVVGATLGAVSLVVASHLALRTLYDLDARVLGPNGRLDRGAQAQRTAAERDGAQAEPRGSEAQPGRRVAEPVNAELNS